MSEIPPNSPTPEPASPTPNPTPTTLEPLPPPVEPPPVAAEPFDATKLTLPEGFDRENEHYKGFETFAKENKLTQPQVQQLIDTHTSAIKATTEALYADWHKQNDTWRDEVKADKEIGGANLEKVLQTVSKVLDNSELTDPKFREALEYTGAGNNPAVARTLYRWAKALTEGAPVNGGVPSRNANGSLSTERPSAGNSIYGPTGPHSGGPNL